MKRRTKRFWQGLIALFILLCLWTGFNTYPLWRDYLMGPPVGFLENDEISLGLYPEGCQSATVFTNDDICASTSVESIENLRARLKKIGVKGTFFVVPFISGQKKLEADQPQVEALRLLQADGHEIAQHGLMHYCEKNKDCGYRPGAEMMFLSREEQVERLKEGREILTALGFTPRGHRSPCFSGTENTFLALNELGYLYGSDLHLPSTTAKTIFLPGLKGRILYPYHPPGLGLLEITSQNDLIGQRGKVTELYQRFHDRGGVFAVLTHIMDMDKAENLDWMEQALTFVKSENTWLCRMDELCRWWLVREKINLQTKKAGPTLIITCENPSDSPLKKAVIFFKETDPPPANYRLVDRSGNIIAEGPIFPSRRLLIDIPPTSL